MCDNPGKYILDIVTNKVWCRLLVAKAILSSFYESVIILIGLGLRNMQSLHVAA